MGEPIILSGILLELIQRIGLHSESDFANLASDIHSRKIIVSILTQELSYSYKVSGVTKIDTQNDLSQSKSGIHRCESLKFQWLWFNLGFPTRFQSKKVFWSLCCWYKNIIEMVCWQIHAQGSASGWSPYRVSEILHYEKFWKFCIGKFHLSPPVRITELVTEFLHDVEFVVEEYFRPLNFYAQLNLPAERLQLLVRTCHANDL